MIWVNGQKIGEGTGNKAYRFNLSGIVGRGTNVFAIEASNKATGVTLHTVSSEAGVYVFPNLPTGVWTVSAEKAGFKKGVQEVTVRTGIRSTADFTSCR